MHAMFHGTTSDNANSILQQGHFMCGTYFGHHMEDALKMGGDYIFEIALDESPTEDWEWRCPYPLSTDVVRMVIVMNPSVVWHNLKCEERWSEEFRRQEWNDDVVRCDACSGRGQREYYPPLMRRHAIKSVTVCEKCGGHGVVTTD